MAYAKVDRMEVKTRSCLLSLYLRVLFVFVYTHL